MWSERLYRRTKLVPNFSLVNSKNILKYTSTRQFLSINLFKIHVMQWDYSKWRHQKYKYIHGMTWMDLIIRGVTLTHIHSQSIGNCLKSTMGDENQGSTWLPICCFSIKAVTSVRVTRLGKKSPLWQNFERR